MGTRSRHDAALCSGAASPSGPQDGCPLPFWFTSIGIVRFPIFRRATSQTGGWIVHQGIRASGGGSALVPRWVRGTFSSVKSLSQIAINQASQGTPGES